MAGYKIKEFELDPKSIDLNKYDYVSVLDIIQDKKNREILAKSTDITEHELNTKKYIQDYLNIIKKGYYHPEKPIVILGITRYIDSSIKLLSVAKRLLMLLNAIESCDELKGNIDITFAKSKETNQIIFLCSRK